MNSWPNKTEGYSRIPDAVQKYERRHGEIFNPIEQKRIRDAIMTAIGAVRTGSQYLTALDYGCGSGNLTRHFIELGIKTFSADISDAFLKMIEQRFGHTGLSKTIRVNGKDLSDLDESQFDIVATYSVLHHVPDYLYILKELCRVVKSGGVIYIDHEVNEQYYQRPTKYVQFLREAQPHVQIKRLARALLDVGQYIHIFRKLKNPRYQKEGDIHVWPDDHIEWDKIEQLLKTEGLETILKQDYLLYKAHYKPDVYNKYKDVCSDERLLIARKRPSHS